jgi:hypothetical protein
MIPGVHPPAVASSAARGRNVVLMPVMDGWPSATVHHGFVIALEPTDVGAQAAGRPDPGRPDAGPLSAAVAEVSSMPSVSRSSGCRVGRGEAWVPTWPRAPTAPCTCRPHSRRGEAQESGRAVGKQVCMAAVGRTRAEEEEARWRARLVADRRRDSCPCSCGSERRCARAPAGSRGRQRTRLPMARRASQLLS